ncbi:MAG: CCA tRNA nucleotidyltransferase [Atribacterota bacterium]
MKLIGFNTYILINEASEKFKMNLPKEVTDLHKLFKENKFKLYVVGGAVRDALLGKKPKDYDVATDATPQQIEKMIEGKYKIIDGGKSKDLGVTILIINGEPFEVATFREDLSKGRRPDTVKFSTIETDVKRRDLTMNALFYDIDKSEIVDLVGGVADINNNKICTVGDAKSRFDEDSLRKLRAIRFAGVTGSKLDINISKALKQDNSLSGTSAERIRDEFKKSIEKAKDTTYILGLINKYGFFDKIFPGYKIDINFKNTNNWILQLAQLIKENDNTIIDKLFKLKYTADETRDIIFLKEFLQLSPETVLNIYKKYIIANKGANKISEYDLIQFAKWNDMNLKLVKAFFKFKPTVNGNDIIKKYNLSGKEIGNKIIELEAANFKELF